MVQSKDGGEIARENHALRKLVAIYRHLSSLAVQEAGLEAVTKLIAEHMTATVAVVDRHLSVLTAASGDGESAKAIDDVQRQLGQSRMARVLDLTGRTRRAVRIPDVEHAQPVVVAPIPVGDDVPAYLLTLDGTDQGANEDLRLLITEHAATMCGVILGRERIVAAAASQVRFDLLEGLLSSTGSDVDEVLRWARHLGYDGEREHRVVAVMPEGETGRPEHDELSRRVLTAVERFFVTHAPAAITALRDGEVTVILPEPETNPSAATALAAKCLEHVRELFREPMASAGVGSICRSPTAIARSYDDARRTIEVARRMGRPGIALAFDDLGIHRLLLQVADPVQLRQFVRDVFGALTTPSRSSAAEYLSTLSCYFRANNSPQRASQALHVHPNTVTYRIRRVEEITKLDFSIYRDRLMAQVALEIMEAVGEGP